MFARSLFNGAKRATKPSGTELNNIRPWDRSKTHPAQPFNLRRANSSTTTTSIRTPRTLVLCFDGTGESFDNDCTNVVRFVKALEKKRPDKQIYYYQPGIGTYLQPNSSWSATRQWVAKKLDFCFAWYLDAHIMGGYRFLTENYREGDYICLFGFSRGAYTARCLIGMLHKVGLLPKSNEEHVAFAYQTYLDETPRGKKVAQEFKHTFSSSVPIEFVGGHRGKRWLDIQGEYALFHCKIPALPMLSLEQLPFIDSDTIISRFRHALALDERRVDFMPSLWHKHPSHPHAAKHDLDSGTAVSGTATGSQLPHTVRGLLSLPKGVLMSLPKRVLSSIMILMRGPAKLRGDENPENDPDDDSEYHHGQPTDVQEVWFAGCHADVGGGSTPNNQIHTLDNQSLQWMVSQVLKHAPFVLFRPDAFTYDKAFSTFTVTKTDSDPKPTRPRVQEQTLHAIEQTDPERDANAEKHDQLVKKPMWHILEYIPTLQHYQDEDGVLQWRFRYNARRPREIYDSAPNFHESVRLRKDYEGKWMTKFIPKPGKQVTITYVK
ncbi:hypothetical protein M407DRAFT_22189 [Tulasnella calospora MUT 4182]|uniref:T6SS Phospholipase effector Tle1-like catalytic domain-containing protein n=1 Tax=Tulasnella calospora MUT 4182 TaxID=1051891 RepID=A0A0C3L453_9AGAM|nr:hypothetical protein M407DRAFT_22189 [Tulasnella calospora MUT 4182]